jgi:hypothetical protein
MAELYANNAITTLSAAITSTSAITLTVTSAALFPGTGNFRILIDTELILVTGVSGTTFTVTRGVEGTTAATHLINASVSSVLTAASLTQLLVSPTLTTPSLGVASATTINKITITTPATGSTLTIADGKTFTASNTITIAGTDSSTLNIGAGGTLGSAAFQASSAFDASGAAAAAQTAAQTFAANASNVTSGTLAAARVGPAGSTTQFQYNNSGTLAGCAALTFDGTNINLTSGKLISGGQAAVGTTQIQLFSNSQTGFYAQTSATASPSVNSFVRSRGTLTSKTAVQSGDPLGSLVFQGYDGSSSFFSSGIIQAIVDGAVSTGNVPTAFIFKVGATSTAVEAFRITSSGGFRFNSGLINCDNGAGGAVGGGINLGGGHLTGLNGDGNYDFPPSIAANAGAGTAGSASIEGSDTAGLITVTAGVAASASSAIVTITFQTAFVQNPYVVLTPGNAATALLSGVTMVYTTSTTTTFVINAGTTGLSSGTYIWNYVVVG